MSAKCIARGVKPDAMYGPTVRRAEDCCVLTGPCHDRAPSGVCNKPPSVSIGCGSVSRQGEIRLQTEAPSVLPHSQLTIAHPFVIRSRR